MLILKILTHVQGAFLWTQYSTVMHDKAVSKYTNTKQSKACSMYRDSDDVVRMSPDEKEVNVKLVIRDVRDDLL